MRRKRAYMTSETEYIIDNWELLSDESKDLAKVIGIFPQQNHILDVNIEKRNETNFPGRGTPPCHPILKSEVDEHELRRIEKI